MEIKLKMAGKDDVIRSLNNVAGAMTDLSMPLEDLGERLVRRIGQRIRGGVLKARSGRLSSSLTHDEGPKSLVVSAGGEGDLAYARIHHYGGVIRPKNAKALTLPFPGGLADKKVPLRASDFKNTFIAKGIIFQRLGRASSYGLSNAPNITPLFILKKSVTIPARPYMYAEDSDLQYFDRSVAQFIAGKWKK